MSLNPNQQSSDSLRTPAEQVSPETPQSVSAPTNSDRRSIFSYFQLVLDPKHLNRFSFACNICHAQIRADKHGHLFFRTLVSHIANIHGVPLRNLDESSLKFAGIGDPSKIYNTPDGVVDYIV
ncbi:MAG: hypothetical protein ACRDF4_00025 [Rhabdochlamydiaceae bacterium]